MRPAPEPLTTNIFAPASPRLGNELLDLLPSAAREAIASNCELVTLESGAALREPGDELRVALFPLAGSIALVSRLELHPSLGLALLGREGMLGASLATGARSASTGAVVHGAGRALCLSAVRFRRALRDHPVLARAVGRYVQVLAMQAARIAACACFHQIGPRLAQWLLMTHDRAQHERFHLTHQAIADVLGVRRSGVSVAAEMLQRQHLIGYARGKVEVLDRAGLEAASCACYGVLRALHVETMAATD